MAASSGGNKRFGMGFNVNTIYRFFGTMENYLAKPN
jgi:hypothetical protein